MEEKNNLIQKNNSARKQSDNRWRRNNSRGRSGGQNAGGSKPNQIHGQIQNGRQVQKQTDNTVHGNPEKKNNRPANNAGRNSSIRGDRRRSGGTSPQRWPQLPPGSTFAGRY